MIGKLLGHRKVQTTARYAHLARESVKAAAERVAANLAIDLDAPANGSVCFLSALDTTDAGAAAQAMLSPVIARRRGFRSFGRNGPFRDAHLRRRLVEDGLGGRFGAVEWVAAERLGATAA